MNYSDQIRTTFNSILDELVSNSWLFSVHPTDFSRASPMDLKKTLKFIIAMGGSNLKPEMMDFFDYNQDIPTTSAFIQQRAKIKPEAFQFLFSRFNELVPLSKLLDGYHALACDGSIVNIFYNPEDEDTFISPSDEAVRGYNALHLNVLYDLLELRYADALIQPIHKKDEKAALCQMVSNFEYCDPRKTIIIADRGYFSYNVIANLQEHGFRYLIRAKDVSSASGTLKTFPEIPKEPDAEFDITVRRYLTRSQSQKLLSQDTIYKNIDSAIPFDYLDDRHQLYYICFRVVRFKLSDGHYEVLITNLPEYEFPPEKLKAIYNARWGIETSFRQLKYTIGLSHLHSRKEDFVTQEIYARLLLYNFCEAITTSVIVDQHNKKTGKARKYFYKVNHTMAMQICREFLRRDMEDISMNVEALISKYLTPVRDGRQYVRRKNRLVFDSFAYRVA